MSIFAVFLAASAMSVPQTSTDEIRFLAHKSDGRLDKENVWSAFLLDLWVAPDGRIADCSIVRSDGDRIIAERNCKLFVGYRIGVPIGPDGKPSFAVVFAGFSAFSNKLFPMRKVLTRDFDLKLEADNLPAKVDVPVGLFLDGVSSDSGQKGGLQSAKLTGDFAIDVQIGVDGKVSQCAGAGTTSDLLARAGCEKASKMHFVPRKSGGKLVSYVRRFLLRPVT